MGFVQDKVMKCPYHGDELYLALRVCFQSLWGGREGEKQNQKAETLRYFQAASAFYRAPSFALFFFICSRDANQESEQFLSERAVQDVKE